jgi:hypothetical protein
MTATLVNPCGFDAHLRNHRTTDRETDFRFLWVFLYENAYESGRVDAVSD